MHFSSSNPERYSFILHPRLVLVAKEIIDIFFRRKLTPVKNKVVFIGKNVSFEIDF